MISPELVPWLAIGYFALAAVGGIVCFFWILGIAFSEGALHGLGCLFCGPYGFYYCVTRWRRCRLPFLLSLGLNLGLVLVQFQVVDTQPLEELFTTVEKIQKQVREAPAEKIARDHQALQGEWRLALSEQGDESGEFEEFRFVEDQCVVQGRAGIRRFQFVLSRSPQGRTIDLTDSENGEQLKGIYRLNGDHFTLCMASPGAMRPSRFATWGTQQRSFLLRRQRTASSGGGQNRCRKPRRGQRSQPQPTVRQRKVVAEVDTAD